MITNDRHISMEAARSVSARSDGVSRHERALQRYLSAEAFETHMDTAPEGWEGRPQHPAPPRTNTPSDS